MLKFAKEKNMINKYKDLVIDHYNNYEEDERFNRKTQYVEFFTTMHYIEKYLKKGMKILEIGAGTGRYSITLAKMGYDVTAVELTPKNLEIMKKNAEGIKNITCLQGDCLELDMLQNDTFDLVLNLGPMYHLYTQEDKGRAISETLRVCKSGGVCIFAYLTHASIVWGYGVRKGKLANLEYAIEDDGRITDTPEEIFTSYYIEDFKKQFDGMDTTFIASVATDAIFPMMRDYIDDKMDEKDFNVLIKWHLATCERLDQQGYSSHMIYICKKN